MSKMLGTKIVLCPHLWVYYIFLYIKPKIRVIVTQNTFDSAQIQVLSIKINLVTLFLGDTKQNIRQTLIYQ